MGCTLESIHDNKPRTTATSLVEGRMRVDVGGVKRKKRKYLCKRLIKN